jgi:hypothetical protein
MKSRVLWVAFFLIGGVLLAQEEADPSQGEEQPADTANGEQPADTENGGQADERESGVTYAPGDEELIKTLGEGYLSNREAFSFLTCHFKVREGFAKTVDEALAGNLEDMVEAEGKWVVDGQKLLFDRQCEDEVVRDALQNGEKITISRPDAKRKRFAVQLPCDPLGFLTDGTIDLRYGAAIGNANISDTAVQPLPKVRTTPFTMGIMGEREEYSPGRVMTGDGKGGYAHAWIDGSEQTGDGEVIIVGMGWEPKETGKIRRRMFIDPNRGCLATRIFTYFKDQNVEGQGARVTALFFTDFLQCSNNRWFPARGVLVRDPDSDRPRLPVKIIEVSSVDADERPADADFSIAMPSGTGIADPTDLRSGFKLKVDRPIGLADLRPLLDETHRVLDERMRPVPSAVEPADSTTTLWWVVAGHVLVLVVFALVYWTRRRAAVG